MQLTTVFGQPCFGPGFQSACWKIRALLSSVSRSCCRLLVTALFSNEVKTCTLRVGLRPQRLLNPDDHGFQPLQIGDAFQSVVLGQKGSVSHYQAPEPSSPLIWLHFARTPDPAAFVQLLHSCFKVKMNVIFFLIIPRALLSADMLSHFISQAR